MSLAPPVSSLPSQQDRYSSSGSFRDGGDSMQFPSSTPISLAPSFASVQSSPRPHTPQPVSSNNNDRMPLSVGFNQDHGCFSCGTQSGFRIYNSDPFTETIRRDFDGAGIAIVEMLFRSSIFSLVGGGKTPRYSPNKVMIWDDHQGRCIGELSFRSQVRAVKLRRDRIVVVLEDKIYVYNLADLKLLHQIETFSNIKGICALSPASASCVLACPGQRKGEIRIELYSVKKTRFLQGHDSSLACMALCRNGALLATASTKGTLIRIFSTADGVKLQELRRGADRAAIYSISFSPSTQWLVLSSDKGTVHVFGLKPLLEEARADVAGMSTSPTGTGTALPSAGSSGTSSISAGANAGSSLSFMRGVLPKYFSSEWSFAQFHVPEETKAIVAFGPQKNTVIIVCANGSYYRCSYDPIHGGEMVQQEYERFMKHDGDGELVTG